MPEQRAALAGQLRAGIEALGEDPASLPCNAYLAYLDLLSKWNTAYNLTGTRDPERLISHHILDSLSILPFIQGRRALDIGTGAGLPGFILALAQPAVHWTLLDANQKKVRFLRQAMLELKPGNVEVVHSRARDYAPAERFDTVVSRALGPLARFVALARPLLNDGGIMLAMKGRVPGDELAEPSLRQLTMETRPLAVPGLEAQRSVVILRAPVSG